MAGSYSSKLILHRILQTLFVYTYVCGLCPSTRFTRPALLGYRCLTDSEVYDNITGVLPYTCVHRCVRRNNCSIVNYNIQENICHMNNDSCTLLIADPLFQVNYLSSTYRSECLKWVAASDFEYITPVGVSSDGLPTAYVSRLRWSSHVLPGKYIRSENKVWAGMNNVEVTGADFEILAVRPGCQVTWMPFRAGETLPVGAVKGGYLSKKIFPLFVIRGLTSYRFVILVPGYFDPGSDRGYLPLFRAQHVTDMDILVLLWVGQQNKRLPCVDAGVFDWLPWWSESENNIFKQSFHYTLSGTISKLNKV